MQQRLWALMAAVFFFTAAQAQTKEPAKTGRDTTGLSAMAFDTTMDYDELFSELDSFLDSLLAPRSFALVNVSAGNSVLNYTTSSANQLSEIKKLMLMPTAGYYNKSGLGISATATVVDDRGTWNPFQLALTGSYDYVKNFAFLAGLSASRYFTKDSLSFYTSPLKNELQAYFSYRKWWVRPGISASYGWGTKKEWTESADYITALRLRRKGLTRTTRVETEESISDFNVTVSARHDFYWLNVFSKRDFIRLSPQLSFTGGTQSYGFNQTSSSYGFQRLTGNSQPYRTESYVLDESTAFRPLSVAALLKSELSIKKFFVQPQLLCNYYLPATGKRLTTSFIVNTGFIF